MGQKYYISAKLNGRCNLSQDSKNCKTLIGLILTLIIYRLKYPIIDVSIRNGYDNCNKCKHEKPLCYHSEDQI